MTDASAARHPAPQAYGAGPYSSKIKALEADVKAIAKKVNDLSGIKESDTGLAHPSRWDLVSDKQAMQEEQPLQVRKEQAGAGAGECVWPVPTARLGRPASDDPPATLRSSQVARCTKIINPNTENAKYVINIKQIAKFVVGLGEKVAPTDIEEGMRVGCALAWPPALVLATARSLAATPPPALAPCHIHTHTPAPPVHPAASTARSTRSRSRCRPRSTRRSR